MTPTPGAEKARKDRLRRLHERQAAVFGLLLTVLAVCSFGAIAVATGAVDAPFNRPFSSPDSSSAFSNVKAPCLPDGTLPVAAKDISVKVINATSVSGIAKENQTVLADRGFTVTGIATAKSKEPETQIRFGVQGVAAAYTVAAHYDKPLLLLDNRKDATVDVIVGEDFDANVDTELTGLDPSTPMTSATGCAPVGSIKPLKSPFPLATTK